MAVVFSVSVNTEQQHCRPSLPVASSVTFSFSERLFFLSVSMGMSLCYIGCYRSHGRIFANGRMNLLQRKLS